MYDKRMNQRLLELNARYQEVKNSVQHSTEKKKARYLHNLMRMDFDAIRRDLAYRRYAIDHFSTCGNTRAQDIQRQDADGFRIAVYTCIVGRYDQLIEPVYAEPGVDYLIYTDQPVPEESVWRKVDITTDSQYDVLSPMMLNRRIKILQNPVLKQYDYTVYVDGNIEVVGAISPLVEAMAGKGLGLHWHMRRDCIYDEVVAVKYLKRLNDARIDCQIAEYRQVGFPEHFGLYENSIIVRDNRDAAVDVLMQTWWTEMQRYPIRDQLSLPYILWKSGFPLENILSLGDNIERNPVFNRIGEHR